MKYSEIETLADLVIYLSKSKTKEGYLNYIRHGSFQSISSGEFTKRIFNLAAGFKEFGLKKGDRVAIFADSSPDWLVFDFALQYIGAVSVPMFTNISTENLDFQIKDSQVEYAFVDGGDKWQALKKYKNDFKILFTHNLRVQGDNIKKLSDIFQRFSRADIPAKPKNLKDHDIVTIIYTSGSTGNPKGVCLTQRNMVTQIKAMGKTFPLDKDRDVALSFLPLAHVFERTVMLLYLTQKIKIYFADSPENVPLLLKEVRPTIMTTVPRFLEKVDAKISENVADLGFVKKLIALFAIKYANIMPLGYANKTPLYPLLNRLLYRKFKMAFGGRIKNLVCGGAPLNPRIYKFFLNIGVPLYQGYGMTESSAVISVNTKKDAKHASSGLAFPNVKIRILEDGEIVAKGPNIMKEYLDNKQATDQIIKDGWLHTGDLGYLDEEGFLFVTGRKKELMKTSNGKYVSPIMIENKVKEIAYVDNVLAVADGRKFVSVIIFPDLEKLKKKKMKPKRYHDFVAEEIEKINKHLNDWEKIRKFYIARDVPTIANDQMTPSMKLRRHVVLAKYQKEIDKLYN